MNTIHLNITFYNVKNIQLPKMRLKLINTSKAIPQIVVKKQYVEKQYVEKQHVEKQYVKLFCKSR